MVDIKQVIYLPSRFIYLPRRWKIVGLSALLLIMALCLAYIFIYPESANKTDEIWLSFQMFTAL